MNRYVRAAICLATTNIKFIWIKLMRGNRFHASPISVCSPFSEFEVTKGGELRIGRGLKVRSNSHIRVRENGVMELGENVALGYGCMIVCHESIKVGNDVQFSPYVLVYDHDHDFRVEGGLKAGKYKTSPVVIGNNTWIGANSIILRGTHIGDNCVIAAGSIVKGNIPDGTVFVQKRDRMLQ